MDGAVPCLMTRAGPTFLLGFSVPATSHSGSDPLPTSRVNVLKIRISGHLNILWWKDGITLSA